MLTREGFCEALRRNVTIIQRQVEGLTQDDSLLQLPFRGNCLNWVVGHMVVHRDLQLKLLGALPVLGDAAERYARESEPITGDGPGVLPLADLLAALTRSQEALEAALTTATEDQLAAPAGTSGRTVRERLFFLYFHDTYHTGQTELLRQLAGKNDKVI